MNRYPAWALLVVMALCAASSANADPPALKDARAVAEAVRKQPLGNRLRSRSTLVVRARKVERNLSFQAISLDAKGSRKTLISFDAPEHVRGNALLSFDYDEGAKDDDQWFYLPSLRRATRIASSGRAGAFMGSDFSYADLNRQDPKDYDFAMLGTSEVIDGEACYWIEATPKTPKAAEESGYVKSQMWVSKDKLRVLQSKHWMRDGRKLKYIKASDFKKQQGVWIAHTVVSRTVQNGSAVSESVLRIQEVRLDEPSVKEERFSLTELERGL